MKYTIKNLINSPYDVVTADGLERIAARGELTAEFDERSLAVIRQIGYFQISEASASEVKRDPLDHDGDGVKGGAVVLDEEPKRRGRPPKNKD